MSRAADLSTLGGRVTALRLSRNTTQLAIGAAAGHSAAWAYGIEVGKSSINPSDLIAVARFLEVDVRWLLLGEESGDSELVARVRGLESSLQRVPGAERAVLALAEHFAATAEQEQEDVTPEDIAKMDRAMSARVAGLPDAEAQAVLEHWQRTRQTLLGAAARRARPQRSRGTSAPRRRSSQG